ncbi:hypothetical protein [Gordonia oryzae]|nr:hypothetical protein [Gordonia oryzae]
MTMQITKVIRCRGIGEDPTGHDTMLEGVTDLIPGIETVELPWSAQYGPVGRAGLTGDDYLHALQQGVALALAELDRGPAALFGYSGGAQLAHMTAAHGHHNLQGVGFIADPAMPKGIGPNYGVTGADPEPISVPKHWVWNPLDIICQCPADSPIRDVADFSESFSAQNFPGWTWDMLDDLRFGRWQVLGKYLFISPVDQWRRWGAAIAGATGYLNGTEHVAAYHGARQRELADWVKSL